VSRENKGGGENKGGRIKVSRENKGVKGVRIKVSSTESRV
jgi:hypothetical protein